MVELAVEVAHVASLAPLAYLAVFRRGAPLAYWVTAAAFAVSFAADLVALLTGGSWLAVPWYQIVQIGLFGWALAWVEGPTPVLAILVYLVPGTALYLGMMQHRLEPAPYDAFMAWWWPYQCVRLLSFALFVGSAYRLKGIPPGGVAWTT